MLTSRSKAESFPRILRIPGEAETADKHRGEKKDSYKIPLHRVINLMFAGPEV